MQERAVKEQTPEQFNTLLLQTVHHLNDVSETEELVSEALREIKGFFSYGSAFVYECDHTKKFFLKEASPLFDHDSLPETFDLEDCLAPQSIAQITQKKTYQVDCESCSADQEFLNELCRFFDVNTLIIIFITDDDKSVIGCVGMADMRKHDPLVGERLSWANTFLRLIAQRAKLRIFKKRLEYADQTLLNIMDHTGFDIYVNDFETHEMLYANKSMAAPYGGWENMRGKKCHEALYEGQEHECEYCPRNKIIDSDGNPGDSYAWDYQRPFDKSWFRVISAAFKWTDGRLAHITSSSDITKAKKNELLVYQMAHYDTLTGIANRRKLEQDLEALLDKEQKSSNDQHGSIAVLFLDLDNFKYFNDTLGHSGGDALLIHIAERLKESPLTSEHCYRYGGDEFVFAYDNTSREKAQRIKEQLLTLIGSPFEYNGFTYSCGGSIGMAFYPEDGNDYWQLLDKADSAMYLEKNAE